MKSRSLVTKLAVIESMIMMMFPMITIAADLNTSEEVHMEEDTNVTRDVEVLYTQASTFTVTIPRTIILDIETKTADYVVNVKGDISFDCQVNVTPASAFVMQDQATEENKKADVMAIVTQEETIWSSDEVCVAEGTTKSGNISAQELTSGSWKGTFTFSIILENVQ